MYVILDPLQIFYFSEFTQEAWIAITVLSIVLICILTFSIYKTARAENQNNKFYDIKYATKSSLIIYLSAITETSPDLPLQSSSYKIMLFTIMFSGYLFLTHYEAITSSSFIVESNEMPFKTWEDIALSNKKILVWKGAASESKFKDAPQGSLLRKIYDEKVYPVPHEKFIDSIGYKGSVKEIMSDKYIVYEATVPYDQFDEHPCSITSVQAEELK